MSHRRIETITVTAKNCRMNPPRMTMAALQGADGRYKIPPKGLKAGGWAEFANAIEPGDTLLFRKTGYKDPFVASTRAEIIADAPEYAQPAQVAPAAPAMAGAAQEIEAARSFREAINDKTKLNAAEMRVELAVSQFAEFKLKLDALFEKLVEQAAKIATLESKVEDLEGQIEELAGEIEEGADLGDAETAAALQGASNPSTMLVQALGAAVPDLLQMGKEFLEVRKTAAQNQQLELMSRMGFKPTDAAPGSAPNPGSGPTMNQGY